MRRKEILNPALVHKKVFTEAEREFYKHCKLKNLRAQTIKYYEEDLNYFHNKTGVKYIDDVNQEVYDNFLLNEIDEGKKTTSLNTRIRGLRVFFNFCVDRGWIKPISAKLMKTDEEIKEPYTEAELYRLLKRPTSNSWTEWRTWAAINYLISTGNRISTVVNLKIEDIDFDEMTIHLKQVKNRHQQIVPLSPALKEVLTDYLKTWDWSADDYLFPNYEGGFLNVRSFQGAVRKYNISRGVSKTSVHLFRHTFAKNFILAGGGMTQLQALLGHSTLEMTRKYVNLYGTDLQKDYARLNPLDNLKLREGR
jgi:integrase/recombinase XerD